MAVASWVHRILGTKVRATGGLGGQCVDLANLYLNSLGEPSVRANAVDWVAASMPPPWRWVPNLASNYPHTGDIVVWGPSWFVGIGPDGHVAVTVTADPSTLLTVDQNWPAGSPVALTWHTYAGVLGWWAPHS